MNLVICLLVARTYVPKSRIRELVGGYGEQSDEAFERMFERDKDELRELGIPIETGQGGADEEPGYRIRRSEFELPPISLEPDEAAVVGLAARVWRQSGLAEASTRALLKLQAAGVEADPGVLDRVEPQFAGEEPAVWVLWQAVRDRRRVVFDYRKPESPIVEERLLEPWSVLAHRGRWYVTGHDLGRGEERLFRLSRITGEVRPVGRGKAYDVPPAEQVRAAARSLVTEAPSNEPTREARLRVRKGAGFSLRRRATHAKEGDGFDEITLTFGDTGYLAESIAGHGADVLVLEPDDLRDRVISNLRTVLESAS